MTRGAPTGRVVPRWLPPAFLIPVALFFVGQAIDNDPLRVAVKSIPVLALAVAVLGTAPRIRYRRLVGIGLIFGAGGDLLLQIDQFEIGLGLFLVCQLFYVAAFIGDSKELRPVPAVVFYAYGLGLVWWLAEGTGDLLIPIAVYAIAITTMLWRAVARMPAVPRLTGLAAAYGAALFVVSDSLIAVNRFGSDIPGDRWLVMITYWAAQALIAYSALTRDVG